MVIGGKPEPNSKMIQMKSSNMQLLETIHKLRKEIESKAISLKKQLANQEASIKRLEHENKLLRNEIETLTSGIKLVYAHV